MKQVKFLRALCITAIFTLQPCHASAQDITATAQPNTAPTEKKIVEEIIDFTKLPEPMLFAKTQYAQALRLNALPQSDERSKQIHNFVNDLIIYDDLAQRALGDKWNACNEEKQAEFSATFKELAEQTYLKKFSDRSFKDHYNIEWDRVVRTKTSATVSCFTKQKDVETELELVLFASQNVWKIHDVLIDGASLANTYRKKYTKKIDEIGVDALLKEMKQEIEKLKKQPTNSH